MSKEVYIVWKSYYEDVWIYGIFSSKEKVNKAIDELKLSEEALLQAKREIKRLRKWYKTHIFWCNSTGRKPEDPPILLNMTVEEVSAKLFNVKKIRLDKVNTDPIFL